jgi:hypothetical protein
MSWMNRKIGTVLSFGSQLSRGALTTLAAASLVFAAADARAACGSFLGTHQGAPVHMPMLTQAEGETQEALEATTNPIVGLWGVDYTAGGKPFNQTLDQWHSDGTEFENADLPVAGGNICFGVWKSTGSRSVRLHHIGWTYDAVNGGPANGVFTLDENNTVSEDGKTYTGTFTFQVYDTKGDPLGEPVKGTMLATRITVD